MPRLSLPARPQLAVVRLLSPRGWNPRAPYCTSTTTLKNRIAAVSAAVAPSTAFHSPFNTITLTANAAILAAVGRGVPASRCVPYRLPVTKALKSLSQEVPTAFTE